MLKPLIFAALISVSIGTPAWAETSLAPASAAATAEVAVDPKLAEAVAGAWRSPDNRARDAARHPTETLTFFGLKPGMTVIELSPGGGWYTEILAPFAASTKGKYIGAGAPDLAKKFSAPQYGVIETVAMGRDAGPLGEPGSADMVLTFRNIHNWIARETLDKVIADSFAVLKPGGVFGVVEHRANPGPQDPKAASGYVTEAFVIAAAEKAGFRLAAKSEVNANPKDTKDHSNGVWTLPPVRRTPAGEDRAKYDAIGESDRMTLRFVKP